MLGRNLRKAFVVAAVGLAGLAVPYSATAAQPGGLVRNWTTGACLDADTGTLAGNGTIVQLWACHGGPNQQWEYDLGANTLRNLASGRCLDVGVDGDHRRIQLWDCHSGGNQRWQDDSEGLTLRNEAHDQCLDADLGTITGNGTKLQLWPCHGSTNQQWEFERH